LVGAGRSEFVETLFGVRKPLAGSIRMAGVELAPGSPRAAIDAGLSLVPEDRKRCGVVLPMCVRENVNMVTLRHTSRAGFYDRDGERRLGRSLVDRLKIRATSPEHIVRLLSGGNQQKVVFAKWLAARPRVLLLDEPTRGIDVGAKGEIHELMRGLARDGAAVLFVSSELEEIIAVADRVLVMHEGRIAGELPREALTEEGIMRLASGSGRN
jgi:ribose transport system ATP-binding protein